MIPLGDLTFFGGVMLVFVILCASVFAKSCGQREYHMYKLQNGDIVECAEQDNSFANISLHSCKDNRQYLNLTNVVKLK